MRHLVLSRAPEPSSRWVQAMGRVTLKTEISRSRIKSGDILWLDFSTIDRDAGLKVISVLSVDDFVPIVCLVASPNNDEAFELLSAGARGYCHVAANVVSGGGFWLPPSLLQRFLGAVSNAAGDRRSASNLDLSQLTKRERQVATSVAEGLSNREIATKFGISERTVKARLTTTFQKLGVRDRVQLALLLK
jgi:two-component system nitrate/nitrite response regulator NarL